MQYFVIDVIFFLSSLLTGKIMNLIENSWGDYILKKPEFLISNSKILNGVLKQHLFPAVFSFLII